MCHEVINHRLDSAIAKIKLETTSSDDKFQISTRNQILFAYTQIDTNILPTTDEIIAKIDIDVARLIKNRCLFTHE